MNVFIFADILSERLKNKSLIGIGGYRNRRVVLMNREALMQGIKYGERWKPCLHEETLCLSIREVKKTLRNLNRVASYIENRYGKSIACENGFFNLWITEKNEALIFKKLTKLQTQLENEFGFRFLIGAGPDRMTAKLSCLTAGTLPRITKPALLKSLMNQIPIKALGIPQKIETILLENNLFNLEKLRGFSINELRKVLGIHYSQYALELFSVVRGIDPRKNQSNKFTHKLTQSLNFDEAIYDPLTLYLAIENRWSEFKQALNQRSIFGLKISIKLHKINGKSLLLDLIEIDTLYDSHPGQLRKNLRDRVFNSALNTPVRCVDLIAEYRSDNFEGNISVDRSNTQSYYNLAKVHNNQRSDRKELIRNNLDISRNIDAVIIQMSTKRNQLLKKQI